MRLETAIRKAIGCRRREDGTWELRIRAGRDSVSIATGSETVEGARARRERLACALERAIVQAATGRR